MSSYDKEYEIIPPSRAVTAGERRQFALAPAKPQPLRVETGGVISSIPRRWQANSDTRTYGAYTRRENAQRELVDANTALGHSLVANARMRHELAELPEILATDRLKREIARREELRSLHHQAEIAEARRREELTEREAGLTQSLTRLTSAREQHAIARRGLLNAEQELEAQRTHGLRYYELGWQQRIGEYELSLEEQSAVLAEQRRRVSNTAGQVGAAEDEFIRRRAEMNADGVDTRDIDAEIERARRRPRK
jgi:hypothetical protein